MSRIVNGEAVEKHIINQYTFKSFDENESNKVNQCVNETQEQNVQSNISVENQNQSASSNNEVIEKLLQKIEELSNNIVNIQTKFEQQLNECKQQIEIEKSKAYEEGYKKGKEEAANEINEQLQEKLELLQASIEKVDRINELFEEKILSIEKELISVALDIAKEVIQKEVSENSKEIAYNLAKSLMEDIKDATKIQIKVNPKDAKYLKEQNLQNVEIIEDEAVKEGGVVILSDIGNIDAQILQRFKAIKEAVLEGHE
ncbi:flagellar assembly protein FliH [Nautilia lithotrophica]